MQVVHAPKPFLSPLLPYSTGSIALRCRITILVSRTVLNRHIQECDKLATRSQSPLFDLEIAGPPRANNLGGSGIYDEHSLGIYGLLVLYTGH